jgi:hypothetical protein
MPCFYDFWVTSARRSIALVHANHFAWPAFQLQGDRAATNAAVFDHGVLALGSVDLQGKDFPAMRTRNIDFNQ